MKIFIVVFISISIHLAGYFILQNTKITKEVNNKKIISKTSDIKYVNLLPKNKIIPKVIQKKIIKKKIKKKEFVKKKITKTIIEKKPPKLKKPPIVKQNKVIKKTIKEPIKEPIKEKKHTEKIDDFTKSYLDLYGKEFKTYPKETQVYLIKNLKGIGAITKIFLEYPYMSIQAHQSGISVVEFMLYPNGSIDSLKIIKTSKFFLLDDNTIETINAAYSDYPRPTKPTVIRIYVKYQLIY